MAEHENHEANEDHEDHGHSLAAWTGVGVNLVGFALMALAVAVTSVALFVIGAVICVLGAVAGKVLSMAGYGAKTPRPDAPDSTTPELGVK